MSTRQEIWNNIKTSRRTFIIKSIKGCVLLFSGCLVKLNNNYNHSTDKVIKMPFKFIDLFYNPGLIVIGSRPGLGQSTLGNFLINEIEYNSYESPLSLYLSLENFRVLPSWSASWSGINISKKAFGRMIKYRPMI